MGNGRGIIQRLEAEDLHHLLEVFLEPHEEWRHVHTYPMWRENILSTRGNFFVPSGRKVAITTRQWQGKNVVVGANSYGNLRLYQGVPKRSDKYNDSDDVSLWRSAPDVKVVGHPEELWYHGGIGFIGATLSCGEYGDTRVYVALMWDTETPLL